ncbi:MAG: hypothetical protein K1Y36_03125 [Blastocatellia bacterium]|nr:hypothetical protein [Blastocatellia bacterium]
MAQRLLCEKPRLEFRLQAAVQSSAFTRQFGVPPSGGSLEFRVYAAAFGFPNPADIEFIPQAAA